MNDNIYKTKSLNMAAFLYASGLKMIGHEKVGREIFFQFTSKEEAEKLTQDYFSGKALVNPQELFSKLHDLKDIIFQL